MVRTTRATTLQPTSKIAVLAIKSASRILPVDTYKPFEKQYQCMAVYGIKDVFPERRFYVLSANGSNSVIPKSNNQPLVTSCQSPLHFVQNKNHEVFWYPVSHMLPNFGSVVHYKPAPDRLQRMHHSKTFQRKGNGRDQTDCRGDMMIADQQENRKADPLNVLKQLEDLSCGHLGPPTISRRIIKLISDVADHCTVQLTEPAYLSDISLQTKLTRCQKKTSSNPSQQSEQTQSSSQRKMTVSSNLVSTIER